jgi:hypothetical protein
MLSKYITALHQIPNNSTPNNSKSMEIITKGLTSRLFKKHWFLRKKGIKQFFFFSDTELLFKCEKDFYREQILPIKDKELDWIWILMLLAINLTILFNLYICLMEVILRLFHGIQFQVKSLSFVLKRSDKKSKEILKC